MYKYTIKGLLGASALLLLSDISLADSAYFTPSMNGAPVDFVVGNPIVGGPLQPAFTFKGQISLTTLSVINSVDGVSPPVLSIGTVITGTGVTSNSIILSRNGDTNNYTLSQSSAATGVEILTATPSFANSMQDAAFLATPAYTSGGCTTTPVVAADSTPYSWSLTNGASGCGSNSTITLTFPPAAHNWACTAHDITAPTTTYLDESGSISPTSVVFTNYTRTTGIVLTMVASHVITGSCIPY